MDHIVNEYRESLYSYISDASKDAQGFRVRFDISLMTTNELVAEADYWSGRVAEAIAKEREDQAAAVADFEALVKRTMAMGAGDWATAVRWLYEAAVDPRDPMGEDSFKYDNGLPFSYDLGMAA